MSDPYRIIITGSRRMRDSGPIRVALMDFGQVVEPMELKGGVVIVHGAGVGEGDAPGCDILASQLIQLEYPHFKIEPHPADWDKYGRAAGPIRNKEMIDAGGDVVLAFPSTNRRYKGTRGTIELAFDAGIRVWSYPVAV